MESILALLTPARRKLFDESFDRWLKGNPGYQARLLSPNRQKSLFFKAFMACHPQQ